MTQVAILLLTLFALLTGPANAQTGRQAASRTLADYSAAMQDLARSASPAVVQIVVKSLAPLEKGDSQRAGFVSEQEATGSGVIVDSDGYIVTNAHVVRNAKRIEVKVLRSDEKGQEPHGHVMPAKLVGLDREVDIAVIKIDAQRLPTLSFVDSDTLRQGQLVLAVGSPLGLQNSLTHGVISAVSRQLNPQSPMVFVQTDAPINPGNSGGPLLDIEGRITGINTLILTESGGSEGIGLAIPSNLAKDVYLKLRKDGKVRRGAIGVIPETITPTVGAALGLNRDEGVILSDVFSQSPAEAAGVQPGDVVLSINGKPMRESRDLSLAIFQGGPGDELRMEILRGTEKMSKTVVIQERPNEPSQLADLANNEAALIRRLGILAVTVDSKVLAVLSDLRRLTGVAVAAVPAEYVGLNPGLVSGDVIYSMNGKMVNTVDELRDMLKDKKAGDPVVFWVERSSQLIYVSATLE